MQLNILQPDDWHVHFRDGLVLSTVVMATARCFGRAIVMPNLKPPITTIEQAQAYRQRILMALPPELRTEFNPLMTLYLTDNTDPAMIKAVSQHPHIHALKYYPSGATTNSDFGVSSLAAVRTILEQMQLYAVPLLIHGEVTDNQVDIFDREKYFLHQVLDKIITDFPDLRIVLEHITTQEAVDYVLAQNENLAATITAHHLLLNRNHIFNCGINPHHYCLPILKREQHRQALLQAATSGNCKFFLGTDSAPHPRGSKENHCGCAGIYTAPAALELYAEAFASQQALDKLEGFASYFGADFYRLPRNTKRINLIPNNWTMPDNYTFGTDVVIPFRAKGEILWQIL
jgi:dihydroorotase